MTATLTPQVALHEIRDQLGHNDDLVVTDPACITALMSMQPYREPLRRGERWVETRGQHLGDGRSLYAVISRDERGTLRVTAHTEAAGMFAERSRIDEEILGRPRGAHVRRMNAVDLLHRTVVNEYGVPAHVEGLAFDAATGNVLIELLALDADGDPIPGSECRVPSLDGWHIH